MHNTTLISVFGLAAIFCISGCKDDDENDNPPGPETGTVTLLVNHLAGGQPLALNSTDSVISPGTQKYIVTDFKYYLSNIKLLSSQTAAWAQAESYHLVNQSEPGSKTITLGNIPPGTYDSLAFSIGVDSIRNHSGAQTGALDPANGMIWSWVTGYKFLQLEGNSFSSPQPNNGLLYHIGRDQNYRTVKIALSPALVVSKGSLHTVSVNAEINRILGTPDAPVLFNQIHTVEGIEDSETIANNYAKMFSLEGIYEAVQ